MLEIKCIDGNYYNFVTKSKKTMYTVKEDEIRWDSKNYLEKISKLLGFGHVSFEDDGVCEELHAAIINVMERDSKAEDLEPIDYWYIERGGPMPVWKPTGDVFLVGKNWARRLAKESIKK